MKPMMIFESGLSGRIYASQAYKVINAEKGHFMVTGKKHDVTEHVEAIIKRRMDQIFKYEGAQCDMSVKNIEHMDQELFDKNATQDRADQLAKSVVELLK